MTETETMSGKDVADELLLDYASGALPEPVSVLVATRLALRPELRAECAAFEAIGGHLLEEIEPVSLKRSAFDAVMAEIAADEDDGTADRAAGPVDAETGALVPEPLRSYLGGPISGLAWRTRGPGLEEFRIPSPDARFEMSLLRIGPGRTVPSHRHDGDELTLVLDGAFSDVNGRYGRGDLAVNGSDDLHAPAADPKDGCICFAVTGGPLKFSNPLIGLYDRLTRR